MIVTTVPPIAGPCDGLIPLIDCPALYKYRAPTNVNFSPETPVSSTVTFPGTDLGVTHSTMLDDTTRAFPEANAPNLHSRLDPFETKCSPVSVTICPPATSPELGNTLVRVAARSTVMDIPDSE
eukprot:899123-Rhodomonas_salina.1